MTELETYEHILSIASALIAENGFANTSMNDIVKASGISKGGIYWHFKSKDDIILALVEGIFKEQMLFLDEILSGQGRASERLTQLTELIGKSLNQEIEGVPSPLDIYAIAMRKPELLIHIKQYFQQYQAHFAQLIQQGIIEGDFKTDNAELAAFIFMSAIEGILLIHTVTQSDNDLTHTLNEATRIFLRGLQGA